METMKSIICPRYGPPEVLQPSEVKKPVPKDNEVLVKIHASAVTASDTYIRGYRLPLKYTIPLRLMIGIRKPGKSVIGLMIAGEVVSAGNQIKRFKKGEKVYAMTGLSLGAYAQYACLKESDGTRGCIAHMPENINYGEATMVAYGGLLALQYLEKGNIQAGQRVLIYGASGTTGTLAVQIAKQMGAHVTGVCSTANMELVKSLGADEVLDYTRQNELSPETRFDFMLDAVGKAKTSKLRVACIKALGKNGIFSSIDNGDMKMSSKRLDELRSIIEAGKVKPVIDKVYTMDEIVEAHRYVETGHKKGGVVITIDHN